MKHGAALVGSLAGPILVICPGAQADPMTLQDHNYTKWLSESGVNYQGRVSTQWMIDQAHTTCSMLDQDPTPATYQATMARLVGGPGNFTQQEAKSTVYAAIQTYCHNHISLVFG